MKKSDPVGRAISPRWPVVALVIMCMAGMPTPTSGYNGYDGGEAYRERLLRDSIEITIAEDEIVAFLAGTRPRQIDLELGETVKSIRTDGQVGAVVTSERLLAISTEMVQWYSLSLNIGETASESQMSDYLVLFVTGERGIVFDPALHRFVAFDLPLGERIVDQLVYADVAVFVTPDRTVGYKSGGNFRERSFSGGETFRQLKVLAAGLVSVITSDRALLFQGPSARWMEWTEGDLEGVGGVYSPSEY